MKIKKENCILPIIAGLIMMLSYVGMKFIYRGNYAFLHIISEKISFPPMWLFNLIYMLTFFLLGVSAGFFISENLGGRYSLSAKSLLYCGGIAYVTVFYLSLSWYRVLFVLQMPIFALIISLLCLISVIILLVLWFRVTAAYAAFIIPIAIWLLYLFVLSLTIVFSI